MLVELQAPRPNPSQAMFRKFKDLFEVILIKLSLPTCNPNGPLEESRHPISKPRDLTGHAMSKVHQLLFILLLHETKHLRAQDATLYSPGMRTGV
jgi:hypothetical protein